MLEIQAIGHLGKDAITRNVNGKDAVNFSIAHSEKYTDKDGVKQERTTWIDCTIWDRPNLSPHLKKGTQVFLRGSLSVEQYKDSNNQMRVALRMRVLTLELLGSAKKEEAKPAGNDAAEMADYMQEMQGMKPANEPEPVF